VGFLFLGGRQRLVGGILTDDTVLDQPLGQAGQR
jgi:hypothetical protein